MKKLLAITALAVMACSPALAATMASQPWVTNRIAEAEARVGARISAATNAIPAPDYSTGNAQLVATIEATAPAPGNYAAVSNRAMTAIQSHQSLWPAVSASTNYTDAALGAFAATGTVWRAGGYGTPTRWTDATGCVWDVAIDSQWSVVYKDPDYGPQYAIHIEPSGLGNGRYWEPYTGEYSSGVAKGDEDSTVLVWEGEAITDFTATRTSVVTTNLVGRVALTNDIPDVTAAIREHSLGGIWDRDLEVWWTPIMENGALRYIATTNVNLNAGN